MNLYFDIDGVLKGNASPQRDIEALVCYAIKNYPQSVYWLTTHCRGGVNRTRRNLNDCFSNELLDQIEDTFLSTDWNVLKTDAIDFSKPFIWFDDTVLQSELNVMNKKMSEEAHYGLFLFDKYDPSAASDALEYLKIVEDRIKDDNIIGNVAKEKRPMNMTSRRTILKNKVFNFLGNEYYSDFILDNDEEKLKELLPNFRRLFQSRDKDLIDGLWNALVVEEEFYETPKCSLFTEEELCFIDERYKAEQASYKWTGINSTNNINKIHETERLRFIPTDWKNQEIIDLQLGHIRNDGDFEMYANWEERELDPLVYNQNYFWIMKKDTDEYIGNIGIYNEDYTLGKCELTYYLFKDFRGYGYAQEALHALIHLISDGKLKHNVESIRRFVYEEVSSDGLEIIIAQTRTDNFPSQKLLESCGFEKCGIVHRSGKIGGVFTDDFYYEFRKRCEDILKPKKGEIINDIK